MRADLYRFGPRINASRWCDGCQRLGLRGRTPTALGRTLILSYYKGKVHFPALPKYKTYADTLYSMGLPERKRRNAFHLVRRQLLEHLLITYPLAESSDNRCI